jgi:hypothetical protein
VAITSPSEVIAEAFGVDPKLNSGSADKKLKRGIAPRGSYQPAALP